MSDIPDPYPDDREPSCETHGLHSPCVHDFPTDSGPTADRLAEIRALATDSSANWERRVAALINAVPELVVEVERLRKNVERASKVSHNHMTRDVKPEGVCPGCDQTHLTAARAEVRALRERIAGLADEHWDWKAGRTLHARVRALLDPAPPVAEERGES